MFNRWLRRKADSEPQGPTPWVSKDPLPPDVLAWAEAVDVSRLPDRTVREAEYYLKSYKFMPLGDRRELAYRIMSVIQVHVKPAPPLGVQPLDAFAIVLAARRRELGIG